MNYFENATEFINWVEHQKRMSKKASLDKMFYYASLFDNPQNKFISVHITGTNGKGSCVAATRAILNKAGLNVATFTSPYVTYFNERIEYNGNYISDSDLLKYANLIISKYPEIEKSDYELPSFFEFITLIAFLYFASLSDLDIALIEVGMGGRLDATNIIDSKLCVITNVSLEHTKILGDTLEKIAYEKLGIVKENSTLITGVKDIETMNFIEKICKMRKAKVIYTALQEVEIKEMDIYQSQFSIKGLMDDIKCNLVGLHQIENMKIVIKIIEILNSQMQNNPHFPITNDIIREGLQNIYWPGRMEILSHNPLIVTDGAHNIDGIKCITTFIKSLNYSYKRAVVAISKDKDIDLMIKLIDDTFDEIIFTKYSYNRSIDEESIYILSQNNNKKMIKTVEETYKYVIENKAPFTIYLGSLYLVTDIKKIIK